MDDNLSIEKRLQLNFEKQKLNYERQKDLLDHLTCSGSTNEVLSDEVRHDQKPSTHTDRTKGLDSYTKEVASSSSNQFLNNLNFDMKMSELHSESLSNSKLREELGTLRQLKRENKLQKQEIVNLHQQYTILKENTTSEKQELDNDISVLMDKNQTLKAIITEKDLLNRKLNSTIYQYKEVEKDKNRIEKEFEKLEQKLAESVKRESKSRETASVQALRLRENIADLEGDISKYHKIETSLLGQLKTLEDKIEMYTCDLSVAKEENASLVRSLNAKDKHVRNMEKYANETAIKIEDGLNSVKEAHANEKKKRISLESEVEQLKGELEYAKKSLDNENQKVREYEERNKLLSDNLMHKENEYKSFIDKLNHDLKTVENQNENLQEKITLLNNIIHEQIHQIREILVNKSTRSSSRDIFRVSNEFPETILLFSQLRNDCNEICHLVSQKEIAVSCFKTNIENMSQDYDEAKDRIRLLEQQLSTEKQKAIEFRDKMILSRQARDITAKEKHEVLVWHENICKEKKELEEKVSIFENFISIQGSRLEKLGKIQPHKNNIRSNSERKLTMTANPHRLELCVDNISNYVKAIESLNFECNEEKKLLEKNLDYASKVIEEARKDSRHNGSLHKEVVQELKCTIKTVSQEKEILVQEKNKLLSAIAKSDREFKFAVTENERLMKQVNCLKIVVDLFTCSARSVALQLIDLAKQKRILQHQLKQSEIQQRELSTIYKFFEKNTKLESVMRFEQKGNSKSIQLLKSTFPTKLKAHWKKFIFAVLACVRIGRLRDSKNKIYGKCHFVALPYVRLRLLDKEGLVFEKDQLSQITDQIDLLCSRQNLFNRPHAQLWLDVLSILDPKGARIISKEIDNYNNSSRTIINLRVKGNEVTISDFVLNRISQMAQRLDDLSYQRTMLQQENYSLENNIQSYECKTVEMNEMKIRNMELEGELKSIRCKQNEMVNMEKYLVLEENLKENIRVYSTTQEQLNNALKEIAELQQKNDILRAKNESCETKFRRANIELHQSQDEVDLMKDIIKRQETEVNKFKYVTSSIQNQHKFMLRKYKTSQSNLKQMKEDLETSKKDVKDSIRNGETIDDRQNTETSSISTSRRRNFKNHFDDEHTSDDEADIPVVPEDVLMNNIDVGTSELPRIGSGFDFNKINSAVHSYMDEIDEKLHKKYGMFQ